MPKSHYEIALEEAQAEVKNSIVKLPLDDAHLIARHARLAGLHEGLERAAKLYREAAGKDVDEDQL